MPTYFSCDVCHESVFENEDHITCDCNRRWCSVRCAKIDKYRNKKTSSSCEVCRRDKYFPFAFNKVNKNI